MMHTHFLNVDLDVTSRAPLDALAAALSPQVLVNYVGRERRRYTAHFSLYRPRNADAAIRQWVDRLTALPAPARRLWKEAETRVFNIGFQSGPGPQIFEAGIGTAALAAAARLRASVVVTIYRAETRVMTEHRRRKGTGSPR